MDIVIPSDILDDLSSRFIINVPDEERHDLIRLFFQIELAHWFYIDFYYNCPNEAELPSCTLREFAKQLFQHIPFLCGYLDQFQTVFEQWKMYKITVPTYGAILMDVSLEKVVLVQSYSTSSWGFPKGKVNADEEAHVCAIREVFEETGFDISELIDENEFFENCINNQVIRLYIITRVPSDTQFQTTTRKEIKKIDWFSISDLPQHKNDATPKTYLGMTPNKFFSVMAFVRPLRQWIQSQQMKN
uniref:m7GpppN-mRNA hydrolase n=1 Tax=Strigamia maritima TaxID=126957 RepID=T1IYD2_STRMM